MLWVRIALALYPLGIHRIATSTSKVAQKEHLMRECTPAPHLKAPS